MVPIRVRILEVQLTNGLRRYDSALDSPLFAHSAEIHSTPRNQGAVLLAQSKGTAADVAIRAPTLPPDILSQFGRPSSKSRSLQHRNLANSPR
ncbi:MAG TPA: hypothetical protein DCE44_24475 [Verrucomicrobiales bacterium]|nr:hypothetical protein [Verrucomicrobiales bacterium]